MSQLLVKVLPILRGLLPMNKIAAWVMGAILVVLAGVAGLKGEEIKQEMCAAPSLPAVSVSPAAPVEAPKAEEKAAVKK